MTKQELLKKIYDRMDCDTIELTKIQMSIDEEKVDEPDGISQDDYDAFSDMLELLNKVLDTLEYYANRIDWKGAL